MKSKEEINKEFEISFHGGEISKSMYEIHLFLNDLGLHHRLTPMGNIAILNVPEDRQDILLKKSDSLNLIFSIHERVSAIYTGWLCGEKNLEGFQRDSLNFTIREALEGENTSKIHFTQERRM